MSYDLFFKSQKNTFNKENFIRYFQNRPNYTYEKGQVWYSNEDTGVYFEFAFQEDDITADSGNSEYFPATLNINYLRPSYFILEAEPEITAFVKYFDLLVSDPQYGGMGDGEYKPGKLISGWNGGNKLAYSMFTNEQYKSEIALFPTKRLHHSWQWNLYRTPLQNQIGESKFVPCIMLISIDGSTVSVAVWPDGIPIVIPPVDYLCIRRKKFAPKKFFRKSEDSVFLAWEAALPILQKHGTQDTDGVIHLDYLIPPADVVQFIQRLPKEKKSIAGLARDRILDLEIYEQSISELIAT